MSQRCALLCRSAVFQRFRRRRWLPPVHRLPPGGDLWHEQVANSAAIFYHRRRERCSSETTSVSSTNPVQRDILPNRHSQFSDLIIRLIQWLLWSLYHKNGDFITKCSSCPLSSLTLKLQITWPVILCSYWSIVSTADAHRYDDHKYVNIQRHQLFIFSEINNGWSMTATVL